MIRPPLNASSILTRFSLDRRISVLVLLLTLIVLGAVATFRIPLELFPRGFQSQSLGVFVPWQNAPTREVLDKITLPLEEELSTVRSLDGVFSMTGMGSCRVFLRFKQGADMDVAYREVRDRLQRARALFPEDADRTFIRKEDSSGIPVAAVGLAIDPTLLDPFTLIQKEVVQPLQHIDGVASVQTDGLEEKEVLIEIDRQAAEAKNLNLYQLSQELGSDNFTLASGTVLDAGRKILLRSVATFGSLDELQNRPITPAIRLGDIAQIRYEEAEKRFAVRVNSRPAVAAIIFKEGEANTVEVSRRIRGVIDDLKRNPRLASIQIEDLFNQGTVVEESLGQLVSGGFQGAALAALVLFLFLQRWRLTAIITLSIPLSLLMALVAIFFSGETLNLLTILGLMIGVGMLVDNSVVVAENIHRFHQDGFGRRDACVFGAAEIALAITLSTLTTVIVFLPAALVEGQGQFFLIRMALPITVSLLASLFVALVFVPLSVYLTLGRHPDADRGPAAGLKARFHRSLELFYERTFGRLGRWYASGVLRVLPRRFDMVAGLLAVLGLTYAFGFKHVKFVDGQEEDRTSFNLTVEIPNEYSFDEVAAYFHQAEQVLERKKVEYGLKGYFVFYRTRFGRIEGWFDRDRPARIAAKEAGEQILKELPRKPGFKVYYGRDNQTQEAKGTDVFVLHLEGDDPAILDRVAAELEPALERVPGVIGIRQAAEQTPSELALVIDRDRATASDVDPSVVAGMVGSALRGSSLPKYNDDGRQVPVRIRFQERDREQIDDLGRFLVPSRSGEMHALSSLSSTRVLNTPKGIFRMNKKISRSITLELRKQDARTAREQLLALQRTLDLPEGVRFGTTLRDTQAEELANFQFAGIVSILFIYLLMGFLFESFVLPLSILLAIPLAGIGVVWAHRFAGLDVDFLGLVGCILLVGVVVNNGIVLVDYINRLRAEGVERTEAIHLAVIRRFRPIAMTSLTTIIGMIPLTLSQPSEIGLSYRSFGLALVGGMTTSTLLTLLVIPLFYSLIDDLGQSLSGIAKQFLARPAPRAFNAPPSP